MKLNVKHFKDPLKILDGWVNLIDPQSWFQCCFRYWIGRRFLDDEGKIARWKGALIRVKGKLVKTIKYVNGRFDDYSIFSKNKQISSHWGYD